MLMLMASPKVKMINVRLKPETHRDFMIACELRGGSMSSILHQFIVRTIREEREMSPKAFAKPDLVKGIDVAPSNHETRIKMDTTLEIPARRTTSDVKKKNKRAS